MTKPCARCVEQAGWYERRAVNDPNFYGLLAEEARADSVTHTTESHDRPAA